jgi:hypothetical protein
MNSANPALAAETDALRGDLRPAKHSPRPIPWPQTGPRTQIEGRR